VIALAKQSRRWFKSPIRMIYIYIYINIIGAVQWMLKLVWCDDDHDIDDVCKLLRYILVVDK